MVVNFVHFLSVNFYSLVCEFFHPEKTKSFANVNISQFFACQPIYFLSYKHPLKYHSCKFKIHKLLPWLILSCDYVIPFGWDEILSCFAGTPTVLWTLHKLYPTIRCKKFRYDKVGSLFCTVGTPFCQEEISPCNRFSPPKRDEKVIQHMLIKKN